MSLVRFQHGTNRNTKAYIVTVGEHDLYISYETVIAYNGPRTRFRMDNVWGPTTGRHMKEMGVYNYPTLSPEDFEKSLKAEMPL